MWSVRVFSFVLVLLAIGRCDDNTTQVNESDDNSQIVRTETNNTNDAEYERNNDTSFFKNCLEENVICVFLPVDTEDCIKWNPLKETCEVKKEKVSNYLNSATGVMISPTSTGARIDAKMQKEHNGHANVFQFELKHVKVTNNKIAAVTVARVEGKLALLSEISYTFNILQVNDNILRGTFVIGEIKQNKTEAISEKNKDEGGIGVIGWKDGSNADKTDETKGNVDKETPKEKAKDSEDAKEIMSTRNLIITISVSSIFFLFFVAFIIVVIVQCRVKSRRRSPSKTVIPPPSISSTSAKPSMNHKLNVKISISAKEEESVLVKTAIAKSEVDVTVKNTTSVPVWSSSSSDEDAEIPFVSVSAKSVNVKKRGSRKRGSVSREDRRNKPLPPGSIPLHPVKRENSSRRRKRI